MSSLLCHVLSQNQPLTYRLIRALDANELWRSLSSVIPDEYLGETFTPTSADDLVLALQNSFVSTADLVKWLEIVNAFDALLLLKQDEPVTIRENPQPRLELEAQPDAVLRLNCHATSFPPPNYQWFRNGEPLVQDQLTRVGPVLEIYHPTPAHSGNYTCRAWNIRGSEAFSRPCKVVVKAPAASSDASAELAALSATDKVALLIANSSYPHDEKLPLTENDVETLGKALAGLNFRIIAFKNLRKEGIAHAVRIFCQFLQAGCYSVFYYAGHGFKQDGRDYIQPVDCNDDSPAEDCVCFQEIVETIRAAPCALNLIMLDACRDTREQSSSPGVLSARQCERKVNQVRRSTIVVYATSPSTSAVEVAGHQNGLFMEHLSKHVGKSTSVHNVIMQSLLDLEGHKLANMQVPVVKYDIPGNHSLSDAILDSAVYRQNSELWLLISSLPGDEKFQIGDTGLTLHVNFSCEKAVFCNSMLVDASVVPFAANIHIDLQMVEPCGASVSHHSSCSLAVHDLQDVETPVRLRVVLRDLDSARTLYLRNIECGWPLVAACSRRNKEGSVG